MVSSATASGLRARADRPRTGSTSTRSPRTATRPSRPAARTTPACSPPSSAFTGSSGTRSRARESMRTASSSPGSRRVGHHRCSLPRFRQADLTPQPHRAGCATALLSALSYPARLGGVACLSGWLPLSDRIQRDRGNRTSHPVGQVAVLPHCEAELTLLSLQLQSEYAHEMPIFWSHGTHDPVVLYGSAFTRIDGGSILTRIPPAVRLGHRRASGTSTGWGFATSRSIPTQVGLVFSTIRTALTGRTCRHDARRLAVGPRARCVALLPSGLVTGVPGSISCSELTRPLRSQTCSRGCSSGCRQSDVGQSVLYTIKVF